jgi:rubrerythrin
MVQSISDTYSENIVSNSSKNKTTTSTSSIDFQSSLDKALSKEAESSTEAAADTTTKSSDEKTTEDLMAELKKACNGMSACSKCGTLYRGTAVSVCKKCGHDMKDDNESAQKMNGLVQTTSGATETLSTGSIKK